MRTYLDNYIMSLSKGQQVLAQDFVWASRKSIPSAGSTLNREFPSADKLLRVASKAAVTQYIYGFEFSDASKTYSSIFEQADTAAVVRETMNKESESKLLRIEAALKLLEEEIDAWENSLCATPEASKTITHSFGQLGLRPILYSEGDLELLSTVIEANASFTNVGSLVKTRVQNQIEEELFCDEEGFQVRLIYNFAPGNADSIRLEPLSSFGTVTIHEGRLYGAQGELLKTFIQNDVLDRTLEYAFPRTVISRVEIELIDKTFNLEELRVYTVMTGIKETVVRTVIPGKTEKKIVGYNEYTWVKDYGLTGPRGPVSRALDPRYDPSVYNAEVFAAAHAAGQRIVSGPWGTAHTFDPRFQGSTYEQQVRICNTIYESLEEALASGDRTFYVEDEKGYLYQYSYIKKEITNKKPIYETKVTPEQIIESIVLEPYTYTVENTQRLYNYEVGLGRVTCHNSFYTEVMTYKEYVCFDGGIPSYITLNTDEFLPAGSYINLYMLAESGEVVPLLPKNREFTTDVLRFNQYGSASLSFYPSGEIWFYHDDAQPSNMAVNGRVVLGPSNNTGALNTLGGMVYWARYEASQEKSNYVPFRARVGSYISPNGEMGEHHNVMPSNGVIILKQQPYVDAERLGDSAYSPVQVVIDGYHTVDLTNWEQYQEEDFPVKPVYVDNERTIHYKVRGNTIFFEEAVNRPVRIYYEYVAKCVWLVIEMGVIHGKAACPVLYSYTMSYI